MLTSVVASACCLPIQETHYAGRSALPSHSIHQMSGHLFPSRFSQSPHFMLLPCRLYHLGVCRRRRGGHHATSDTHSREANTAVSGPPRIPDAGIRQHCISAVQCLISPLPFNDSPSSTVRVEERFGSPLSLILESTTESMAEKPEAVDPDEIGIISSHETRSSDRDPEKTPAKPYERETHDGQEPDNITDQIPHSLLEELAPNGEYEHILSKINAMSTEEALAIIRESLTFHADDWNFPTVMRTRMQRLVKESPKEYGDFYERDLRIDAVMMRWSSPYPGVRAVAELTDNDSTPVETIRAYFLGISWAVIGTFMATFFNSRFPSISTCWPSLIKGHGADRHGQLLVGVLFRFFCTRVQRSSSMSFRTGDSRCLGRDTRSIRGRGRSKSKCLRRLPTTSLFIPPIRMGWCVDSFLYSPL